MTAKSPLRVVACCGGMVRVFGLERMTFQVLSALRSRGASVHCILNGWENHRIKAMAEGIGASTSTGLYYYAIHGLKWNVVRYVQLLWDVAKTSLGLIRDATRFRATHVFLPDYGAVLRNAPALVLHRLRGIPVLLRVGNAPERKLLHRRLWRWVIAPLVDALICNSRYSRDTLLEFGVPARKVGMIYNTLPARSARADPHAAKDPGRIIYVGQIIPEKGVHLLLDAVGLLVERGLDPRLDVVGLMDGWEHPAYRGYWARLRTRAAEADLAKRVRFLGFREDAPDLMRASGVHCCPSELEGFGTVNLEAKYAGIPSVVTPAGGVPELFRHREDGWICEEVTPEALAEGLAWFLTDARRLERASKAARESSRAFDPERNRALWWSVFAEGEIPERA